MIDERRKLVRLIPVGIAVLFAALVLAACGGSSGIGSGSSDATVTTAKAEGQPSGTLDISNWPFYIDKKTVSDFEKATGIKVNYAEDVNDNAEFFGKMQPLLSKGQSGGRDIMVVTDWMAKKMYDLGYLQNFDKKAVAPAMANLRADLAHPVDRPESRLLAALADRHDRPRRQHGGGAEREVDQRPLRPQYKGKVEMLTEMRDTVPLVMKADGVDPADRDQSRTGSTRSTRSARRPSPVRSASSPATTTRRISPTATPSR